MPQLLTKALSWFKANSQVRKHFDGDDLRRLGESLRVKQLQPVLAQPDGTIIAGERRFRAAKLVGLETLEVKVADEQLTESQIKLFQLQENMQRENLKPIEEVDGVAEIARMNPQWTGKELAANLHLDVTKVSRLQTIANCPLAHAALADGRLKGIGDAYTIAKAPQDQKAGLLNLKINGNLTRDELAKAERESRKPATPPSVKLSRVSVPLTTGTRIVVTGSEMTLEGLIEALSAALEAAKKANRESLDVKTAEKVWRDKAAKTAG